MDLFGIPHNRTRRDLIGIHHTIILSDQGKNAAKYNRSKKRWRTKMIRRRKDRARIPKMNEEWQKSSVNEKPKIVTFNDHIDIVTIESDNKGRKIERKRQGSHKLYFPTAL